jgi:hypothetical protein
MWPTCKDDVNWAHFPAQLKKKKSSRYPFPIIPLTRSVAPSYPTSRRLPRPPLWWARHRNQHEEVLAGSARRGTGKIGKDVGPRRKAQARSGIKRALG